MAAYTGSADTDDTDLRDRHERDRLVRHARASRRREPPRYVRESASRFSDNVQTIDRVADRIANDVNALTRAWSASNAEAFKGVVTIVGNIALDLFGGTQSYRAVAYDDDARDPSRRARRPDTVEEVGSDLAGFTHSLSDAFAGAASVVARSSRRFQEEFDSALDEGAEFDADIGREDTDPTRDMRREPPPREAGAEAGAKVGTAVDQAAATLEDAAPGTKRPR